VLDTLSQAINEPDLHEYETNSPILWHTEPVLSAQLVLPVGHDRGWQRNGLADGLAHAQA